MKQLWDLIEVENIRSHIVREVIILTTIKNKIERATHLLRDEEAYIVAIS